MFGYVLINKPEMKFKEYDIYRSYYCGLCKAIKGQHGFFARISVNYDLTFLAILLSGLYEPSTSCNCERCIVHPLKKNSYCKNSYLDYCADMNIYLTYLKCLDDWNDEKKLWALVYSKILKKKACKIEIKFPDKTHTIKDKMSKLTELERQNCDDIDTVSGTFGEIMMEIFDTKDDVFTEALKNMGFYLGKFIYILDAYEDLEEDKKDGCYNPLVFYEDKGDLDVFVKDVLLSMMAQCCKAFEFLPILDNVEILRNILYSGVWTKYNIIINNKQKG